MAIYHNSSKIIGRSKGRSAVGASAYRSGEKLYNEYDGIEHDYTKKTGVVYSEIMIPSQAKEEFKNRKVLWNEVEKIEKSRDSQLAREVEVSLPKEFNRAEQIELIKSYVQDNFVKNGMCADINIHDKGDGNPHAHVMLTMREIKENGEWGAKQEKLYLLRKEGEKDIYVNSKIAKEKIQNEGYEKVKNGKSYKTKSVDLNNWNSKEFLQSYREDWANKINEKLKEKGINERVDHRSFEEQGIEKVPTKHEGYVARAIEKRGELSDRMEQNRNIKEINKKIEILSNDIKKLSDDKGGIELMEVRKQIEQERAELERLRAEKRELEKNNNPKSKEEDIQKLNNEKKKLEECRNEFEKVRKDLRTINDANKSKLQEDLQKRKDIEGLKKSIEQEKEKKAGLGFFKKSEKRNCDDKINKYLNQIGQLEDFLLSKGDISDSKQIIEETNRKLDVVSEKIRQYNDEIRKQEELIKQEKQAQNEKNKERQEKEENKSQRIPSKFREKDKSNDNKKNKIKKKNYDMERGR